MCTTSTSTASIVDAIATTPDDLTWQSIVEKHASRVYRLAYHLTGNQHDAEDLTQDVFVRVFNSLSQYTPGTFEGWLHRITTNLFLCLLYTSDAADDLLCVDLGGRRII